MIHMRTSILVDPDLLESAAALSGLTTASETVDLALKELVARRRWKDFHELKGKVEWEGNLAEWRSDDDCD